MIAAIVAITWACNSNRVSNPASILSTHSITKGHQRLLTLKGNSISTTKKTSITNTKKKTRQTKEIKQVVVVQSEEVKSTVQESYMPSDFEVNTTTTDRQSNNNAVIRSLDDLFTSIDKPKQNFPINVEEDVLIYCKEGTAIYIPALAFELPEGEENATVSIDVQEYYGISSMLHGNLNTMTEDGLLESGGTVFIEAKANGKEVKLKKGKDILIGFPIGKEKKNDMDIFGGKRDENNKNMNWTPYTSNYKTLGGDNKKTNARPKLNLDDFNKILKEKYKLPKKERFFKYKEMVYFEMKISDKGKLMDIQYSSIEKESVEKAIVPMLEKLRKWQPAKMDKIKVESTVTIPVRLRNRRAKVDIKEYQRLQRIEENANVIKTNAKSKELQEAQVYAFASNSLGWINCDRFLDRSAPKANMTVHADTEGDVDFKLVFKKINAIMQASEINGGFEFYNLPNGMEATLIGMQFKGGKIYIGIQDMVTGKPVEAFAYREVTKEQLKDVIDQLNM